MLTANPDLKAIYAACGPPAAGAAQAIKNAGIDTDTIVLVGFDFCCGEEEALTAGIEDATVAQFPSKMARARRRCPRQGDSRRKGRIADRFRRCAGHQGQHGTVQVGRIRGPARWPAPAPSDNRGSSQRDPNVQLDRSACLPRAGNLEDGAPARAASPDRDRRWCARAVSASAAPTITSTKASILTWTIRGSWVTNWRWRSSRRPPADSRLRPRRDLCRQSVPFVRQLCRLPGRQAELLRQDLRARRPPGRRHERPVVPAGEAISFRGGGLTLDECACVEFLVDRRPCGATRRGARRRPRACRRRRPDRSRRRPVRAAFRRQTSPCSTSIDERARPRAIVGGWQSAGCSQQRSGRPEPAAIRRRFRRHRETGRPWKTGFSHVAHGGRYVLVSVVKEAITFMDPDFHRKEMTLFGSRNATVEGLRARDCRHPRPGRFRSTG